MIPKQHRRVCKECAKEFLAKHQDANYCSVRCKNRAWRREHAQYYMTWRKKHPRDMTAYRVCFPQRTIAHRTALRIPLDSKCEECGDTENLERHHLDYFKPHDIITLCGSCHRNFHINATKQIDSELPTYYQRKREERLEYQRQYRLKHMEILVK